MNKNIMLCIGLLTNFLNQLNIISQENYYERLNPPFILSQKARLDDYLIPIIDFHYGKNSECYRLACCFEIIKVEDVVKYKEHFYPCNFGDERHYLCTHCKKRHKSLKQHLKRCKFKNNPTLIKEPLYTNDPNHKLLNLLIRNEEYDQLDLNSLFEE